jgi:MFS family permease
LLFRGKYQGVIGSVVAIGKICRFSFGSAIDAHTGYTVGPLIGGVLAERVSWKWCFWVTIPPSFAATIVVVFILPLKPVEGSMKRLACIPFF